MIHLVASPIPEVLKIVVGLIAPCCVRWYSNSGRPAIFFRDPDMNGLEVVETEPWR